MSPKAYSQLWAWFFRILFWTFSVSIVVALSVQNFICVGVFVAGALVSGELRHKFRKDAHLSSWPPTSFGLMPPCGASFFLPYWCTVLMIYCPLLCFWPNGGGFGIYFGEGMISAVVFTCGADFSSVEYKQIRKVTPLPFWCYAHKVLFYFFWDFIFW